ncbi:glycosyltransferase family 4 protein [Moellerella wisconsensis]|uniref:Glycosyltransferase family 4 protein n=1 Tax=Moellerella wisconsensis TaxID=158849 RepID=A0ACD3Y4Z0_9GAMM|nr:glycosyltransferase family 4 protein [Moellerella wisconsensis]UNH38217.1 glycosyltransferase family 4 protein [Moellerella wisconsensis]
MKSLKEEGYRIVCIAPFDIYSKKLINELNIEWFSLNMNRRSINPLGEIRTIIQLCKIYKKISPDICINFTIKNNIYGTIAAKLNNTLVINNITGLGTAFQNKGFLYYTAYYLYKTLLRYSNFIFCQNKSDFYFIRNEFKLDEKKIILTPGSGVNLEKFKFKKKEKNNTFNFLFVGRLIQDKGINELIDAFKLLNNNKYKCHLYIAGEIDENNRTAISSEQFKKWQLIPNITWLGSVNDMPKIYNSCDCIVLPSYSEGLPRSLIEAGAMGLPAIASDIPGCNDIISNDFNGYLCKVKDSNSLYLQMIKMLTLPSDKLKLLSKNSLDYVEEFFNETIVIDKTKKAVEQLLTFNKNVNP